MDQSPGTTMIGETPPSSLVIGLSSSGVPAAAALGGILTAAPDDEVVGGRAAGDVHVGDALVLREVGAHVAAAGDDAQDAEVDEGSECRLVCREQRVEGRVELEDDDAVVGDELVEDVERGDRGDVAGPEDEADPAGLRRGAAPRDRRVSAPGRR